MTGKALFFLALIGLSSQHELLDVVGQAFTGCSLCQFSQQSVGMDFKNNLHSKLQAACQQLHAQGRPEFCGIVGLKAADRMTRYLTIKASEFGDCSSICSTPRPIPASGLCTYTSEVALEMEKLYEDLREALTTLCSARPDLKMCEAEVQARLSHGQLLSKSVLKTLAFRVDPKDGCGIVGAGPHIRDSPFPPECALCGTLTEFLTQSLFTEGIFNALLDVVMKVCKLIAPLVGIQLPCDDKDEMGPLLQFVLTSFVVPMLYPQIDGISQLCNCFQQQTCPSQVPDSKCPF
ncbi:unnamed protein product, partial [Mesorhabditis spiculigera]